MVKRIVAMRIREDGRGVVRADWPRLRLTVTVLAAAYLACVGGAHAAPPGGRLGWSRPAIVDHSSAGDLTSVSCPSASFCMAVDERGDYVVYRGSSWSAPQPATPGDSALDVSCASATFCVLTGAGGYSIYNGASWTPPQYLGGGGSLAALSCPTSGFCAAITDSVAANGQPAAGVSIYDGLTWSPPQSIGLNATLADDVSCTSASFCVAVGNTGKFPGAASVYDGASWSHPVVVDRHGGPLVTGSCATRSFCLAEDSNPIAERTVSYRRGSWSRPSVIGGPRNFNFHVACVSSRFCMATTESSTARSFNGRRWSPQSRQLMRTQINSLSCPTESFCMAVGDFGEVVSYHRIHG